jgi:hypothetical protein
MNVLENMVVSWGKLLFWNNFTIKRLHDSTQFLLLPDCFDRFDGHGPVGGDESGQRADNEQYD